MLKKFPYTNYKMIMVQSQGDSSHFVGKWWWSVLGIRWGYSSRNGNLYAFMNSSLNEKCSSGNTNRSSSNCCPRVLPFQRRLSCKHLVNVTLVFGMKIYVVSTMTRFLNGACGKYCCCSDQGPAAARILLPIFNKTNYPVSLN